VGMTRGPAPNSVGGDDAGDTYKDIFIAL
jgi:hypothetical protein